MSRLTTFRKGLALALACARTALGGVYDGAAGTDGSLAVAHDDPSLVGFATGFVDLVRGPAQFGDPAKGVVSFGSGEQALGPAGLDPYDVVSLGDGGAITLIFAQPITDGPGWDFAVFENSFSDVFLELAVVEVSSNGVDFFRFDAVSDTPAAPQVGGFGTLDPTHLDNLAGKYRLGFGTPFDLAELAGRGPLLDLAAITHVRIVDVVGVVDAARATLDAAGRVINDPWPTPFATGGFDLDAVGVRHVAADTGYAAWRRARFSVAGRADDTVAGTGADPDRDGRVNLLEYALGTEPHDPADGATRAPGLTVVEGGRLALAYDLPAGRDDLAVVVEWSADLANPSAWYSDGQHVAAPHIEPLPGGGSRFSHVAVKNLAEAPRQFLRLSVSLR